MNIEEIKQGKTIKELLEFGIINIDKPSGPTSFSVSEFVCKKLGLRKTSHFGTLDPKVTGVLPVGLNRACKLTGYFLGEDKEYVGVMRIHEELPLEKIKEAIQKKFLGVITQMPPVKSRVKRQDREREIYSFELLEEGEDKKDILFRVKCQGGTYIRKLIDDLGSELNIGAHMLELRRTDAGIFNEEFAVDMYEFEKAVDEYKNGNEELLKNIIIPGEIIAKIYPEIQIKEEGLKQIFTGKPIYKKDLVKDEGWKINSIVSAFCNNRFVGMYKVFRGKEIFAKSEFVMQSIS
ncbi:MAG: RNA-guided pseudouridylation complex pseudouridine synthase subunit Cbf5 [Nanobdellota archaeon]